MSQTLDLKSVLKMTKLNPVQKMGLTNRFKDRAFPTATEQDNVYEVIFGQNVIHIRSAENGLNPDEMDIVADVLQRGRKNEQKAMFDMLTLIQILPLSDNTVDVLLQEWAENGVESKLVKGPKFDAQSTSETVAP